MYLGQYRQGDEIVIPLRAWEETPPSGMFSLADAYPQVRTFFTTSSMILIEDNRFMAAYEHPFFEGYFRYSLFLGPQYSAIGYYTALLTWRSQEAGNKQLTRVCPFEILPGGHEDGTITSLAEVVRPDKRFLICGTTAGKILRRKNPRVPS